MNDGTAFQIWLGSLDGLLSRDLWNIRDLSLQKIDEEEIDFYEKMKYSIDALIYSGKRPIDTYNGVPKWVDTFYEKGDGTTHYDEIMVHVWGTGEDSTRFFWIGSRLPTHAEIEDVEKRYA